MFFYHIVFVELSIASPTDFAYFLNASQNSICLTLLSSGCKLRGWISLTGVSDQSNEDVGTLRCRGLMNLGGEQGVSQQVLTQQQWRDHWKTCWAAVSPRHVGESNSSCCNTEG